MKFISFKKLIFFIKNANYQNNKVNSMVNDKVKLSDNAEKILNAIINKPLITRKELEEVMAKRIYS